MSTVSTLLKPAISAAERGRVPDRLIRLGIRRLCGSMLDRSFAPNEVDELVERMKASDVALVPELANEQHYEVPPEFFEAVLGRHLKYSCCHWSPETATLDEAESAALEITGERADLADGQHILELGCGWGSLTLWMAERFPLARITAVSNSAPQARFIRERAEERGLGNIRIATADMNDFEADTTFDRVVSVEMFEHMRNWGELLGRIARWLRPNGRVFVHVFRHVCRPYLYGSGADDWMGRHFFSGGIMPSRDMLARFDSDLQVMQTWDWNGGHYQATAEAWLQRLDANRAQLLPVLARDRGEECAERWINRWRLFFLACAELFGYAEGEEWGVSHYLLAPVRSLS